MATRVRCAAEARNAHLVGTSVGTSGFRLNRPRRFVPIGPPGTLAAVRLLGIPVPDDDLRRIVPTLLHGDETSRTLAGRIASGLDRRVALLALNVDERGALLDVLEEEERPALAELRGVLADDLAHRRGIE